MKYMTDMNDGLAIFQAMALQAVANDLHTSLNSLSNPKTYKSTDEKKKRLLGYPTSMGSAPPKLDRFRQRLRIGRSARFKFTSCSNSIGGR